MKTINRIMVCILTILLSSIVYAQAHRPMMEGDRSGPDRLREFRKIRLIESLKLKEEDAARFVAKQNVHEEKMQALMKTRNEVLDFIDSAMQIGADVAQLQSRVDQVLDFDQKMFAERRRYQDELRKLFTPEQFTKYLIFERKFERNMREAMQDMRRGQRRRMNE